MKTKEQTLVQRPPVVVVMGHIDHGKSTLLDYIRKTSITKDEAGGITQHISAYELTHTDKDNAQRKITFLDTPGHEAFQAMRARGARAADIAILVIAADDSIKPQTLEAYKAIQESKIPFIIALNKIDKQNADPEQVKRDLMEHEIFVEGLGGTVPVVSISAVTGVGIDDLLTTLLLLADVEGFTGTLKVPARGVVIETKRDARSGIAATLIIKDGTLSLGEAILAGDAIAPVRAIEDYLGARIKEAHFSSPIRITGWDKTPHVGDVFEAFTNKKAAEKARNSHEKKGAQSPTHALHEEDTHIIPVIIKTDTLGSIEAIEHEIAKLANEKISIRIIHKGVGTVNEGDVKTATGKVGSIVIGFNVAIDRPAEALAQRLHITIRSFDVIYRLTEWLTQYVTDHTPFEEVLITTGRAKVLRTFNRTKDKQVIGCRLAEGVIERASTVRILRRESVIAEGKLVDLQQQKIRAESIKDGEFGAQIECRTEIAHGDFLEAFKIETRK